MPLTIAELGQAREIVAELLGELGLETYLFEVKPRDTQWLLQLDCPLERGEAWETLTFPLSKDLLFAVADDSTARQHLLSEWRQRLVAGGLLQAEHDT